MNLWFETAQIYPLTVLEVRSQSNLLTKSQCARARLPPKALGENPFPCLFQLIELLFLHSLAHGPFLLSQSQQCSICPLL